MGQMQWPSPVCTGVRARLSVSAQVKGFNSFPNWMKGADMAQSDPGLAAGQWEPQ